jgi:2-isopropylmalate synthase
MVKERQRLTDAELFLLLAKKVDRKPDPFKLLDYETHISRSGKAKTEIKLDAGSETLHEIAEGVGPVHSFDLALRKALGKRFSVDQVKLSNFRVRILNQEKATAASVEVFIEFRANGNSWSMTGISDDIIRASEEALINGYKYYLLKNGMNGNDDAVGKEV